MSQIKELPVASLPPNVIAQVATLIEALENLTATVREVKQQNTHEFMVHLRQKEVEARAAIEQAKKARG